MAAVKRIYWWRKHREDIRNHFGDCKTLQMIKKPKYNLFTLLEKPGYLSETTRTDMIGSIRKPNRKFF